jgi:hypothetical protein
MHKMIQGHAETPQKIQRLEAERWEGTAEPHTSRSGRPPHLAQSRTTRTYVSRLTQQATDPPARHGSILRVSHRWVVKTARWPCDGCLVLICTVLTWRRVTHATPRSTRHAPTHSSVDESSRSKAPLITSLIKPLTEDYFLKKTKLC